MPVYEYECMRCGEKFELQRNVGDSGSEVKCPRCSGKSKRRFSLFGFGRSSSPGSSQSSSPGCGPTFSGGG
ncbi:MAG: zinc ribbon domain-containing protein [Chloroflexi bacterium]|nr:zinc ribbon domain-containing protein [Chloroflexota bacterium]